MYAPVVDLDKRPGTSTGAQSDMAFSMHSMHTRPLMPAATHPITCTPPTPTSAVIREWTVAQVSQWLRDMNLSQHVDNFVRNDINGEALLQIDQSHLKEMAVMSIGERVRLHGAIRQLVKRAADADVRSRMVVPDITRPVTAPDGMRDRVRLGATQPTWPMARMEEPAPNILVSTPVSDPATPMYTQMNGASTIPHHGVAGATFAPAQPAPLPAQRPSTSAGVMWPTNAIPTMRRPATASSVSSTTAPSVPQKRGAFTSAVPTVSAPYNVRIPGDQWQLPMSPQSTSMQSTQTSRPNLEEIKMRTIKFIGPHGTTRIIDVCDIPSAAVLISRVLRKFGLPQSGNVYEHGSAAFGSTEARSVGGPWAVAMQLSPTPQLLSDSELMTVCRRPQAYDSVWHPGLYLLPLANANSAPWISRIGAMEDPTIGSVTTGGATLRRASTLSILSGLGVDGTGGESQPQSETKLPPSDPPASKLLKRVVRDTQRQLPLPTVRRRARNFFGQRPPSELISSHLPVYFPRTDLHLLEQHTKSDETASQRTSGSNSSLLPADEKVDEPELVRRSSLMTIASRQSSHMGDSASLTTVDEITKELEDSQEGSSQSVSDSSADLSDDRRAGGENEALPMRVYLEEPISPTTPAPASGSDIMQPEASVASMRWHKGALIGAGSFGRVFLGMNATTGLLMAVKQVELPPKGTSASQRRKDMLDSLEVEIELLKTLEHPNIVQYLGSFSDGEHLNIFLEYVPGGSVAALLRSYGAFEEQLVQNFVRQVLHGLNFLHSRGIVHRDIKGANILVDNKGGVKISDFGISKKVEQGLLLNERAHRPSLQGSVFWMAPEVVKQTTYTRKADIWSVGCLVVEMISGTHPWPTLDQMQAIFRIGSQGSPPLPDEITEQATSFLVQTFEQDHMNRPTAAQLLDHPFLKCEGPI